MYLRPSNIIAIIMLGIAIGWFSMGGAAAIMFLSSETRFCTSCHSMQTPKSEYQASKHFNNPTGIRAECADCHIPSDPVGYLIAKTKIVKDIYHEFYTKSLDTSEQYQARKTELAERVWAQMRSNDSAPCRECHNSEATDISQQPVDRLKIHNYGIENNITCIDCHKGTAHFAPVVELDTQAFDLLQEKSQKTSPLARKVYPLESITVDELGTISPAVELKVLKLKNGTRTIELFGYQLKGQEHLLYLDKGKRAIVATLTPEGLKQLVTGDYQEDEFGNQWRMVSWTTTTTASLMGSVNEIWNYARKLNNVYCTACHIAIPANDLTVNMWEAMSQKMAKKTNIIPRDLKILTKYLQTYAKDMVQP